jgi:hypothetical protein
VVDDQLELRRLHHRQVRGLRALEDTHAPMKWNQFVRRTRCAPAA